MKILSISLDNSVLDKNSLLAKKTIEYGNLVDQYLMIVPHSKDKEAALSDRAQVYGVGGVYKALKLFRIYGLAKKIIAEYHCNIITVQDPFESALVGWLLAKKFKIGLNIQEHGDFFSQRYWRNENTINFCRYFLGSFLIKKADSVRAVSEKIKQILISKFGISEDKIVVVPVYTEVNIDKSRFNNILDRKYNDKFVFLTMGRFVKQKNFSLLIKAFKNVARDYSNVILIMVGKGEQKDALIKLTEKIGLESKIKFIDWTDNTYLYYKFADTYVLSSNYEGWGRVIIEAGLMELPIIMTDVGCAGEVIKDGKNGLIIPIGDQDKLEKAMIRMVKDVGLRKKLGQSARRAVLKLPDKEENLGLYKKSWEKAMRNDANNANKC